jgi:hypothetical protein
MVPSDFSVYPYNSVIVATGNQLFHFFFNYVSTAYRA